MIDAIITQLKQLSQKATDLLALNVDTYNRLNEYNTVGMNQTALDLSVKGCSIEDVRILDDETETSYYCRPAFWSSSEIGIMYASVPTSTAASTYSAYRTYNLSTSVLSTLTAISTVGYPVWHAPVRKFSAGFLVPGFNTNGSGYIYKYDTSFSTKSNVSIAVNKVISGVPWYFESDVIYFNYFENAAGVNDIVIPKISSAGYNMSGSATATTSYANITPQELNGAQLKYKNYLMSTRYMFGKKCLIVTDISSGQLYYLPPEMMNIYGIQGVLDRETWLPSRFSGYSTYYDIGTNCNLVDMFVDTKIHLLGVIAGTNTPIYMKFGWLT